MSSKCAHYVFDQRYKRPTPVTPKAPKGFSRRAAYEIWCAYNGCKPEKPMPAWDQKYRRAWDKEYGVKPAEKVTTPTVSEHPSESLGYWYNSPREALRSTKVWAHMLTPERPLGTLPEGDPLRAQIAIWLKDGFPEEAPEDPPSLPIVTGHAVDRYFEEGGYLVDVLDVYGSDPEDCSA